MKTLIPLTALVAFAASGSLIAQTPAFSKPSGYITTTITGKATANAPDVFNLIGIPLQGDVVASGTITAITSASLTDAQANFSTLAAGTYLLEVTSGAGIGTIQDFNSFTATVINLVSNLTTNGVAVGHTYRIRKVQTITTVFGSAAASLLQQGDVSTADIVWISNGSGGFERFHISPPSGIFQPNPTWTRIGAGSGDPATTPIIYTDGIIIQRRGVGNLNLVSTGSVKTDAVVYPVLGASGSGQFNYYSTPFPTGLSTGTVKTSETTVQSLGLRNLLTAGSIDTADILWLPQGNGTYKRYYVSPPAGIFKPNETFEEIGISPVDPAALRMPSAYIIQRRGATQNANALPPSGFSGL